MNPVTVELLNSVEKYRRSKQVEVYQLLNQAQAGRSSQPGRLERVMQSLGGTLLIDANQRLKEWRALSGRQVHGRAAE
jgi:hypothetical protein